MAKNKPRELVIFLLFRVISFFIFLVPLRIALKVGAWFGKLAFYALKKERKKALTNLDIAFGDSKSIEERKIIARVVFENLGKNFVEVVSIAKFKKRNIDKYIACKAVEIVKRLIQQGKGGIILSAHFGNWELLAHYLAIKGYKINVIARRVRMEQFERFLDKVRCRDGVKVLYRDTSAKEVINLLKRGEFVGVMPDQDMDSVSSVFVDFFGKKAYTPDGPAALNFLTKAPIVLCFIVRKEFGHEIIIEKPMEIDEAEDKKRVILKTVQKYTKVIESYIRRFPSQWVWFHERWKTRP